MNQTEVATLLSKIQSELNLNQVVYKGNNVWPVLRYYLARVLMTPIDQTEKVTQDHAVNVKKASSVSQRVSDIFKIPLMTFKYKKQKDRIRAVNAEVIFISPAMEAYPDLVENKRYSRYLDPYYEVISKKYNSVKLQFQKKSGGKEDTFIPVSLLNEDFYIARKRLTEKLKNFTKKADDKRVFYALLEELNAFSKKNNIPFNFEQWLANDLDEVNEYKDLFKDLLKENKCRMVFFECYYSTCIFGLISACKELNIPTIDIQHGNVDINYLSWKNMNKEVIHYLPDYYWVWSENDRQLVEKSAVGSLQPVLGGNMWLKRSISQLPDTKEILSVTTFNRYNKRVLVSLQYSYFLEYTVMMVKEAIQRCAEKYLWMIRFHPLNTEGEKIFTLKHLGHFINVEYEISSGENLYSILKIADAHIVASSAVAKEGLLFNIPTIIVHEQGCDLFKDLIDKKVFATANNADTLLEQIHYFRPLECATEYKIEISEKAALKTLENICSSAA
jgi:hypothetical protein